MRQVMGKMGALLLAAGLLSAPPVQAADAQVEVGEPAPKFLLRDLEGVMHRLGDLAYPGEEVAWKKKKKVLLDFFRTDCKPCMEELPQVVAYHEKHGDEVQVLLIALLEEKDGRAKLDAWLKKNPLPFPVLVDAYETAAKKYIVKGESLSLPAIFLIDENGVVRAELQGLKENIEQALADSLESGGNAG